MSERHGEVFAAREVMGTTTLFFMGMQKRFSNSTVPGAIVGGLKMTHLLFLFLVLLTDFCVAAPSLVERVEMLEEAVAELKTNQTKPFGVLKTGAIFYSISDECSNIKPEGKYVLSPATYYRLAEIHCPNGSYIIGSFKKDFSSLSAVSVGNIIPID